MRAIAAATVALACASMGACATVQPPIGATFRAAEDSTSILVMDPDVTVTFLTTGGPERRADWSEQAKANLTTALVSQLTASGEQITIYNAAEHQTPEAQQALLLNQAVTDALAAHVVFMDISTFAGPLPHQAAQPETYTLAEAVQQLAPGTDADYALFMTSRSQIESGGVFWTKVLIGAATGYTPASANFRGTYLSLVDLHSGDVVWLRGWNLGDPRSETEAASIIGQILEEGPFSAAVAAQP